jgi:hypothetical protein
MLEPYAGKLARTVLRGLLLGDWEWLLDKKLLFFMHKRILRIRMSDYQGITMICIN